MLARMAMPKRTTLPRREVQGRTTLATRRRLAATAVLDLVSRGAVSVAPATEVRLPKRT